VTLKDGASALVASTPASNSDRLSGTGLLCVRGLVVFLHFTLTFDRSQPFRLGAGNWKLSMLSFMRRGLTAVCELLVSRPRVWRTLFRFSWWVQDTDDKATMMVWLKKRLARTLIDVINRAGVQISQVCYHPQLGPIQTSDTCMVKTTGNSCERARPGSPPGWRYHKIEKAGAAQRGSVSTHSHQPRFSTAPCATQHGNCTVHNTERLLGMNMRRFHFIPSLTKRIRILLPLRPATMHSLRRCVEASKRAGE